MLHTLKPAPGSSKKRKRIARGNSGSGGTTAGRGTKGQHSRTGKGRRHGFEGGQTPLIRRQPKLGGFQRPRRMNYEVVNTSALANLSDGTYDLPSLRKNHVVRTSRPVKLLLGKEVSAKLKLTVNAITPSAKLAIEKAGGSVTVVRPDVR